MASGSVEELDIALQAMASVSFEEERRLFGPCFPFSPLADESPSPSEPPRKIPRRAYWRSEGILAAEWAAEKAAAAAAPVPEARSRIRQAAPGRGSAVVKAPMPLQVRDRPAPLTGSVAQGSGLRRKPSAIKSGPTVLPLMLRNEVSKTSAVPPPAMMLPQPAMVPRNSLPPTVSKAKMFPKMFPPRSEPKATVGAATTRTTTTTTNTGDTDDDDEEYVRFFAQALREEDAVLGPVLDPVEEALLRERRWDGLLDPDIDPEDL